MFLEESLELEPHVAAETHLASLELNHVDLAALDADLTLDLEDVDTLVSRSEQAATSASLLETGTEADAEAEAEAETETETETEAEAETEVDAVAEVEAEMAAAAAVDIGAAAEADEEMSVLDLEAHARAETARTFSAIESAEEVRARTGQESEAALVAAAEAEMQRDFSSAERDVLDLSDVADIL